MFLIFGPHPQNSSQVVLPNPLTTNAEGLSNEVIRLRMEDGSLKTFVKRKNGRRKFRWEFVVGQWKAKELEDFVLDHSGKLNTVQWRDKTHLGYITLNPVELRGDGNGQTFRIQLEFEEK